jgi:hypothetical protein
MIEACEWFETVTLPVGGEAAWCDGALRLWLDRVELAQPWRRVE